ncbi:ATP-binding protein [Streptomyces sp. TRM 70351]|uniref:ATP-binding protein n=1 Tax=Streptomyces sp. TRM 70351 TaxID=3116552 RepID=UPI002E7AF39E|nr:ATP-binding protein [Streptomyces sp. TRM 70351]MEE1929649.1 ATP-binding protein [Streptomyces sp. TRM 70351]
MTTARYLFSGPGATRALLRSHDWASTGLGPVEEWPDELVAAVRTVFDSRMPMLLWWGPELLQIYNEAYAAVLGDKHPRAVAQPAAECWTEIWDDVGHLTEAVMAGGEATYAQEQLLYMRRHGYDEETYWTFSYSAITDGSGVCGLFVAASDVTARVLGERRLLTLSELGAVSATEVPDPAGACRAVLSVLSDNRRDLLFGAAYLCGVRPDGVPEPAGTFGLVPGAEIPADGPLAEAVRAVAASGAPRHVRGLADRLASLYRAEGALSAEVPDEVMVLPLAVTGASAPTGVLALGISPHRAFDEDYQSFTTLVAAQAGLAVGDALAYQAERQRAQALAELDAAKTRFFQNVSHEFRTPLTLLLGPLGDLLRDADVELPDRHREGVAVARRAALRLQRLVDSLVEGSRAAAGELHARREPTDVAALTADTVSMFRSAAQQHGVELVTAIEPTPRVVPVDREMWLKTVSNLLSNAVKFTLRGRITVALRGDGERTVLTVADTGVGIAPEHHHLVFERFQRVPGPDARSAEGSGIGLSLVADLLRLHGGTIELESTPGEGSTFTVTLPHGPADTTARAPEDAGADRAARPQAAGGPAGPQDAAGPADADGPGDADGAGDVARVTEPFTAEAALWGREAAGPSAARAPAPLGSLLLVEDNADMRHYLTRLLEPDGWSVTAVGDAEAALARRTPPDLVLSDVMLPGRDGLELVRALRARPDTARLPILLLTARAGSRSATEGLAAGADDYIVKPFEPRELLARVRTHHELNRLREYAVSQAQDEAASLQRALASNRQIGTAMGVLMALRRISAEEAFALLRRTSQEQNRKLRDVADDVVTSGTLLAPR